MNSECVRERQVFFLNNIRRRWLAFASFHSFPVWQLSGGVGRAASYTCSPSADSTPATSAHCRLPRRCQRRDWIFTPAVLFFFFQELLRPSGPRWLTDEADLGVCRRLILRLTSFAFFPPLKAGTRAQPLHPIPKENMDSFSNRVAKRTAATARG